MSDNDSVFSEKSQDLNDRGDVQQLPSKYLYICSKCGYGTNKAGSMLGHAVRLRPCNVQLDENYILERARKIYNKLLDEIIKEIEDIKNIEDIDVLIKLHDKLLKNMRTLKNYSRAVKDFNINDYDELHESIISNIKKQKIKLFQI